MVCLILMRCYSLIYGKIVCLILKKTYEILYFGPQTYLDSDGAVILVSNHRFNHTMV